MNIWPHEHQSPWSNSTCPGAKYAEIGISQVRAITWRSMFRLPQVYIAHYVSLLGTTIGIVGPMTLCMKDQGTYTRSKEKHNKKKTLWSLTPQEEEISILIVDIEDEEEEEERDKAEERILALDATIAARSTML